MSLPLSANTIVVASTEQVSCAVGEESVILGLAEQRLLWSESGGRFDLEAAAAAEKRGGAARRRAGRIRRRKRTLRARRARPAGENAGGRAYRGGGFASGISARRSLWRNPGARVGTMRDLRRYLRLTSFERRIVVQSFAGLVLTRVGLRVAGVRRMEESGSGAGPRSQGRRRQEHGFCFGRRCEDACRGGTAPFFQTELSRTCAGAVVAAPAARHCGGIAGWRAQGAGAFRGPCVGGIRGRACG